MQHAHHAGGDVCATAKGRSTSSPWLPDQAGDTLYTASMKPIMTFLEDSGPGVHDTTAAACSHGLYVLQIGAVCTRSALEILLSTLLATMSPAPGLHVP